MMYASLHCNHANESTMTAEWVRCHVGQEKGSQDYFRLTLLADGSEVTVYLSPTQLDTLADKLSQAGQDRHVELFEKASGLSLSETGGGG